MSQKIFNIIFLIFLSIQYSKTDLPVHCVLNDIKGKWKFSLFKEVFDPSLKDEKTTCGHGFPNHISEDIGNEDYDKSVIGEELILELRDNFKLYKNNIEVGKWTPIYDQSFLIYYGDSVLTANFKYFLENEDSNNYKSDCGKTMIGWFIKDYNKPNKNWSCFFANKIKENNNFLQLNMNLNNNEKKNNNEKFEEKKQPYDPKLLNEIKYEDLQSMVNAINNANLTWNADVYKKYRGKNLNEIKDILGLRKGLKRRKDNKKIKNKEEKKDKINDNFNKKTKNKKNFRKSKFQNHLSMIQTKIKKTEIKKNKNSNLISKIKTEDFWKEKIQIPKKSNLNYEIKQKPTTEREKDSHLITDRNEILKYINSSLDSIDENKLPLNWDWRNVGGENFVSKPINQGNCGSCFTISTIYSLESRLRIKTLNKDQTKLSIQFPLSCNFYSEGCDGGYPILVGKFFHEFEIVPKDCFEYEEEDNDCENVCDYTKYKKKYIVSEYGYLGGFYGADTELLMIKELRARGPIPGNIMVPLEFNYYKNGIFSEKDLKKNNGAFNVTSMISHDIQYEKVEHSTTIVGYGEENGVKFWICENTWGDDWGENGFFRVKRGNNEINIETMGDYFNIDILDRNK